MRSFTSLTTVLLTLLASQSVSAAVTKAFTIQNWLGSAYFNNQTKQFEYCSANSNNKDGIAISYSVDRQFVWKLAFSSTTWDFAVGHAFNVTLTIGDEDYRSQRAAVIDNRTLEMQVTDPIALFDRLRTGQLLRVQAGGLSLTFELADSDEVLPALVRCVAQQTARKPPSKGTSAASAKPLQLAPASNTAARDEAQSLAARLPAQSRIADTRFVTLNDIPSGYRANVAWKKGTIFGTISIVPPDDALTIETLPSDLLNSIGQKCAGRFFLISAPDRIDQMSIGRLLTSCRTLQGTISAYHLGVPRSGGGFYLLATINNGFEFAARRPAEDIDNKIRAVITGVVAKQEQDRATVKP